MFVLSTGIANKSDFFFDMEARDEQQMIKEYEGKVLSEITYQVQGQTAISYNGIKFIVGKLGHIKVLPDSIKVEFIEKPIEMWVATVVALNEKYDIQLPGGGEQPYMMSVKGVMKPDPFSRRKALSKATRNALRAVIPEPMILKFLEDVKKGNDFNPPSTRKEVVSEVIAEQQFTAWGGDLSIPNIQAYLTENGFEGEKFKIRHEKDAKMFVVDSAPWTDDFDFLLKVVQEMGGEYDREHKKTVFRYSDIKDVSDEPLPDLDEGSQPTLITLEDQMKCVLEVVTKLEKISGSIKESDLYDELSKEHDLSRSEADRNIRILMKDGAIYTPKPGYYRGGQIKK